MKKLIPYLCVILLAACDTGSPLENIPPDTRIFLDEVQLQGENRLTSILRLHWTGEDVDGYIKGYELSFDAQNWTFVTTTDSVFNLSLEGGSDTTDVNFYVRSIDNEDAVDPDPAYLLIPIKNTLPTARLDTFNVIPDTVFSVWSVFWQVDDLDGRESLDSVFFQLNDGPWYGLDPDINFLTFVPQQADVAGEQNMDVYIGSGISQEKLDFSVTGGIVGADNEIHLRSRDIAGAFSEPDTSNVFFLRQKTGDLLLIDLHGGNTANGIYFPILDAVYPNYDYLNLLEQLPPFWDPTFGLMLKLYDKVFWYTDGTQLGALGERMGLEIAANQIQEFFNGGGKLLVSAKFVNPFPNGDQPNESPIFDFSPLDSLSTSIGQARVPVDSMLVPQGDFAALSTLL